jgi:nucleotide-binding universal stress UspA family protein
MPHGDGRLLVTTAPGTSSSHALDWALRRGEEGWTGLISVLTVDEPSSPVHDDTGAAIHERHRSLVGRSVRRTGRPSTIIASDARKAGWKARTIAGECGRDDLVLADYTHPPLLAWLAGVPLPQRLVATTPCPTGVVPHAWHDMHGRVVLILRGRHLEHALAIAAREARAAGVPLDLVAVPRVADRVRRPGTGPLRRALASPAVSAVDVHPWPRPLSVRTMLRALRPGDLAVIPRTRTGALRGVLTGALEQRLLRRLRCPLLVVPGE